jgi:predicted PhzF superfamily epimerase YddE/YHI9
VFLDGHAIEVSERQGIAAQLGFSETVFVQDRHTGTLAIHTPTQELPFAGHPLVGTAWLLSQSDHPPIVLRPPAGEVQFALEDELAWVRARPEYSPSWDQVQLDDPATVLALDGPPGALGHVQAWAWQDHHAGVVRARVFAPDYGVGEDPATGSAAIVLCGTIGRELRIIQGPDGAESEIHVRPLAGGWVRLGGRVIADHELAQNLTRAR